MGSDLSDDTMLRLDERLAEVFRQHLKSKTVSKNIQQEAEHFQMRCFELLQTIVYSITDAELLLVGFEIEIGTLTV